MEETTGETEPDNSEPELIDGDEVSLGNPRDFMVPVEVDGLPEGAIAIDFFHGDPQIVIRDDPQINYDVEFVRDGDTYHLKFHTEEE